MFIPPAASARALAIGVYAHILREASALFARSTTMGNAKASTSGTGNRYGSHALLFITIYHIICREWVRGKEIKMKKSTIRYLVMAACCISSAGALADTPTPCLIFTGEAQKECVVDLSKYNHITFGENSMTVSDQNNPAISLELLYTEYSHMVFEERDLSGIGEVSALDGVSFKYDKATQSLSLTSEEPTAAYNVGIFSSNGVMVCHTTMRGGDSVSLDMLAPGVYVAVATNGNNVQKIKFLR